MAARRPRRAGSSGAGKNQTAGRRGLRGHTGASHPFRDARQGGNRCALERAGAVMFPARRARCRPHVYGLSGRRGGLFRKTRIFPIMHAIGIRRSLVEKHPWLAVSVYKAFLKAKQIAIAELGQIGHLAVSLPWPVAAYDQACASLGPDYWSYGANENRKVLETLARYSFEQGLSV